MTHYESRININNHWRTLLVVETEAERDFGTSLTFTDDNITTVYRVGAPIEHFSDANGHKYWFVPTEKQIITHENTDIEDIVNALLGVNADE